MSIHDPRSCPNCGELVVFSKKRLRFHCSECELSFDPASRVLDPQTIFLSYAHKSERDEDFDVSEELVLLIKAELDRDGHTVWIDKEGIRAGYEWRERITDAILGHAHFLSFLSRRSVRDPGVCLNEIATALGSTRHLQTVLVQAEHEVAPPLTISHIQWHDFQDWREIRAGSKTGRNGEGWDTWFAQRMALLREAVGNVQNARVSGELQRLRDILVPSGFEARIVKKTQGFYGRQWLFDATRTWLDDSTSRMFWLKASPGIGKSAFAAKLAHQARSAVIGFFMCDFQGRKDPEESAREAICTLAFQMASRLPDYRLKLLYQQQVDKEKVQKKSADDLFEYLITEPLNKSGKIPEATRLCLVIDGLDEAGRGDGGNALAELLAKHAERLPEWLGIIVTSRPEPYLEQILKPLSGISVDGQTEQNRQDLAAYIGERLPAELKGHARQRVIDAVIEKSGGIFLYLSLVEEDKTLDISKPETLPDKLDGIFKQNFNRYFPDAGEYGNKTEPFLRLIAAAPGPLPAQMGRQILGWSQRDLTLKVIEPLGSLLQERDGGLVFFHASLSDWLKDPKRSGPHCVEDSGAKELGEFIWSQFEVFESTEWKQQVVEWLAKLMRHTGRWNEVKELNRAAKFLGEQLRHRDAIAVRRRELERIAQTLGAKSVEAAECMHALGWSLNLIGDSTGAFGQFQTELVIRERLAGRDPDNAAWQRDLGICYVSIGGVLEAQGNLAEALEAFRKFLANFERLAAQDPDNPGWQRALGEAHVRIGHIFELRGDLSGALAEQRKALEVRERFAAQNPDTADWQHDLGVSYNRIGGILEAQGDLAGALAEFRKYCSIFEGIAAHAPDNARWQRELGVSYNRIGGILEAQGDLAGALAEFRASLAIRKRLAAKDPDNAGWQHDLGVAYHFIGGILQDQGDLAGALVEFYKDLVISERLTAQNPDNVGWQYDLGVSHTRIGGILEAQGNLADALTEQREGLKIRERFAAQGPDNAGREHDLGVSYYRIGGILEELGDLFEALPEFRNSLAIFEPLAAQDPDNAGWQRDLGMSCNRIGGVLEAQGDLAGALAEFRKAIAISERLAAQDPDNAGWQSDLSVSYGRIGGILEAQGDLAGALEEFRKDLTISERLASQDPDNAGWQRHMAICQAYVVQCNLAMGDMHSSNALLAQAESTFFARLDTDNPGSLIDYAAVVALGAEIAEQARNAQTLVRRQGELRCLKFQPQGTVSLFHKRFIPIILKWLAHGLPELEADAQVAIISRAIQLGRTVSTLDLTFWRQAANDLHVQLVPGSQVAIELAQLTTFSNTTLSRETP